MILGRADLGQIILTAGVPAWVWGNCLQSVQGVKFGTVARPWVERGWTEAVENLPAELVEVRQLGGGRSRRVPRYFLNGFNCRGHGLYVYSQLLMGFALQAARSPTALDHDALALGVLHYTAEPRADNLLRAGRHLQLWFIDHAGQFQTFEPGDGEENEATLPELQSITFLYGQ